jgi:glycosyltransferase involved in cell wall biosynthesis
VPLVYRACDLPTRHHILWRWVWKYICRRTAVFVCDSKFIRDRIIELGAPADRCQVIHSPAPDRPVSPQPIACNAAKSLTTVLYVGQISQHKGVDLLVEVAKRLLDQFPVRFILVGDYKWKNELGENLVRSVEQLGLQERIVFKGFLEDLEPVYAESSIHVAPSVWDEPYGITVVEAKLHGLPSVVFPSGGLVELVEHCREGWVCTDRTATSLEMGLRYYLENPEKISEHGKSASASLEGRLHLNEYADRWTRAYES